MLMLLNVTFQDLTKQISRGETNLDHQTSCSPLLVLAHLRAHQPLWSHYLLRCSKNTSLWLKELEIHSLALIML